jgi:hypothetical protein
MADPAALELSNTLISASHSALDAQAYSNVEIAARELANQLRVKHPERPCAAVLAPPVLFTHMINGCVL